MEPALRLVTDEDPMIQAISPNRFFEGNEFIPKYLADEIMSDHHFKYAGGRLYVYENGLYIPDGEDVVEKLSQELLQEKSKTSRIKETINYIKREVKCKLPEPDVIRINLHNGSLDWRRGIMYDHDPEDFTITQIPVSYDKDAQCPHFDAYLTSTFDPEVIPLIEELMGYCLIPDTRFQKAFMLTGSGSNGKSILLETMVALLGLNNVSNISIQDLEKRWYKIPELVGKLANIFADIDAEELKTSGKFKVLVSGDRINTERKYGQPFELIPYARLIFSANEIPPSADRSDAFYRRWIIIPFTRKFEGDQVDRDLKHKLTTPEELSGILNLALRGLNRLYNNNEFTMPRQCVQALNDYMHQNDSVATFISECTSVNPDSTVNKQLFYATYKSWCKDQGQKPVGQRILRTSLIRFVPLITEGREPDHGQRFWKGIELTAN